jgi:filamentous hemagglutinin
VVAQIQGNSALSGASGATIGEFIAQEMYPGVKRGDLTEEQRQTISSLSTLAAGLAGGLTGDSSANVLAGAQAGKNAVENNSLAGDKARESVKESKEYWKEKVRETMGENLGSQLTNGLINFAAETGDLAMFGGDAGYDLAMALGACATGNSYCSQAQSDLAKKDAAAAGMLSAMMNGDAWEGISTTVVKAWNGDQRALENVAGILTGIMVPAKAMSPGGKGGIVVESTTAKTPNVIDNSAHNASNAKNLNAQLVGTEIAGGHAFEKHVLQQGEFTGLGIRTRQQFAEHVESVVRNPTSTKELTGGRSAYWDQSTGTVVIRNPKAPDGGTAFRPTNGRDYFDNLR